jgi:7-cyano-7-deazaguanine reductase
LFACGPTEKVFGPNENNSLKIGNPVWRWVLAMSEAIVTMADMHKPPRYTPEHAKAGLDAKFPEIETWPNQFPGYEVLIEDPEFTSVCPKTGLPDFGVITVRYMPEKHCLELKSLKEYLQSYRNLGIFQENIVNQVLEDVVRWARPVWAEVKGDFRPRGGISTIVVAHWPRPKARTAR